MKQKKNLLRTILYITIFIMLCFGTSADALPKRFVPAYAPRLTGKSLIVTQVSSGSAYQPQITMYAPDGRTLQVQAKAVEIYQNVGWFTEPVRTMYAADGRTLLILTKETAAYENVGWFTEPPVLMYAMDGRTLAVKQSEVPAYENVGWFTEPPIRVYAIDGRTLDIKESELAAYLNVGWFRSPEDFPHVGAMVALTFDDGPSKYTDRILDTLAKYNGKATFFVVGNNVGAHADVLKRAYDMGMEIGNHTMTHPNLKSLSEDAVNRELTGAANKISDIIGVKPTLLRPPYGNYNSTVSSVSGTPLILWSIDTLDWKTRNADKTVSCVLNEVKDGSIILMHDLYDATAAAAERIIPELTKRGYRLVTVSELARAKGCTLTNGKAYRSFH